MCRTEWENQSKTMEINIPPVVFVILMFIAVFIVGYFSMRCVSITRLFWLNGVMNSSNIKNRLKIAYFPVLTGFFYNLILTNLKLYLKNNIFSSFWTQNWHDLQIFIKISHQKYYHCVTHVLRLDNN